ncbi:MAG: efflux RND transporter permease subunit [Thermodesulfobacteriota bacterium]
MAKIDLNCRAVTEIIEGRWRLEVTVRYPQKRRSSPAAIGSILVATPEEGSAALAALAGIIGTAGPRQISRNQAHRRMGVDLPGNGQELGTGAISAE